MKLPSPASEILDYLARNPHAEDTIEGIQRWWIADPLNNSVSIEALQHALDLLVDKGVLVARINEKSSVVYSLNPKEAGEAQER